MFIVNNLFKGELTSFSIKSLILYPIFLSFCFVLGLTIKFLLEIGGNKPTSNQEPARTIDEHEEISASERITTTNGGIIGRTKNSPTFGNSQAPKSSKKRSGS
jgi:hypothetical protein